MQAETSGTPRGPNLPGIAVALALAFFVAACDSGGGSSTDPGDPSPFEDLQCDLNTDFLADGGVGRDGIPSIDDPVFVPSNDPRADYLRSSDRVLGVLVDGQAYAIPHNILWWHEIVNMEMGGEKLAVTLCPLTGSSLAFDRSSVGGDELGVSGLLFQNNLIMFNRGEPEGLWPQMFAEARCGDARGETLAQWPVVEMTWAGWESIHPSTRVLSGDTGFDRDYQLYPYPDNYESLSNTAFLFPGSMPSLDSRRPAKERVVGVPPTDADPGIAFPFGLLGQMEGAAQVVEFTYEGEPAIVLWTDDGRGGMAYRPRTVSGQSLTLKASGRAIRDLETDSRWKVTGDADSGELAGERLEPLERTYVAFWGAWAAFHPETRLWDGA